MRLLIAVSLTTLLLAASGGTGVFVNPLAHPTLTRYGTTPVVTRGTAGSWNAGEVDGEQVFYDTRLKQFVMVAGGYEDEPPTGAYSIGLWYSRDLLTWTEEATNPVFTANATEVNVVAPTIVQLSAHSYRMYYQSYGGTDGGPRIYAASSTDLLSWSRLNGGAAVLTPGAAGAWDSEVTFDPHPRIYGTTTYLYYGGQKDTAGTKTRGIGYATSANGVSFTKYASNPILTPTGGDSQINLGAMSIIGDATSFTMWHDSSTTPDHRYINRVVTTDGGATWDTVDHDWFGPGSGWDSGQVFDASAIVHNHVLYLFYAGSTVTGGGTGLSAEIGLATMAWPIT